MANKIELRRDVMEKVISHAIEENLVEGADLTAAEEILRRIQDRKGEPLSIELIAGDRRNRKWTPDEEHYLIRCVQDLQKSSFYWDFGNQYRTWGLLATEFERSPRAIQAKYEQLVRKGKL